MPVEDPDSKTTIESRLSEPFDPKVLGWKPQMVKNNRALATVYIDARDVMNRLDAVLGGFGWQDEYHLLPDGNVLCKLSVRPPGNANWTTKSDVGGPSDQPDQGDRLKAAVSDALKRAAVKFGVGRYLYAVDVGWVDYDPVKKQIVKPPQLPYWALPYDMRPNTTRQAGWAGDKPGAATVAAPKADPKPTPTPTPEVEKAQEFIDKNAKPAPAPPTHDEWVQNFRRRIAAVEVPSDLTAMIAVAETIENEATRKMCKGMMGDCRVEHGWLYDKAAGEFVAAPEPADEVEQVHSPEPEKPKDAPKAARGRKATGK